MLIRSFYQKTSQVISNIKICECLFDLKNADTFLGRIIFRRGWPCIFYSTSFCQFSDNFCPTKPESCFLAAVIKAASDGVSRSDKMYPNDHQRNPAPCLPSFQTTDKKRSQEAFLPLHAVSKLILAVCLLSKE